MTVFVYVNTSKQVGDLDHIKVFATMPQGNGSSKMIPRESRSSMRFWNEPQAAWLSATIRSMVG
jgi:hypothetical protein